MRGRFGIVASVTLLLAARAGSAGVPLDVSDPTPRSVFFEVETSIAPSDVAQVFGEPRPASWSASGDVGTLTISAATHEEIRSGGGWTPVPGSFDPIVIQIDLTTLEATSAPASGAIESGNLGLSFTQNALDSAAAVAYVGPDVEPFICTSQAEVDALCLVAPQFCGQVCTPVSGVAYDVDTGLVNLVGPETQTACDGAQCFGPYDFFATGGDLRLTEEASPTPLPAAGPAGSLVLALLLGAASVHRLRRSAGRRWGSPRLFPS